VLIVAGGAATLAFIGGFLLRPVVPQRLAPSPAAAVASPSPVSGPATAPPAIAGPGSAPARVLPAPHSDATPKARHRTPQAKTAGLPAPLDCARPATSGERAVCRSPSLRADDRRMARAYAGARAAGAPPRILWRDQVKWLDARDAAARRSRGSVAQLYRIRIQDLEARPYRACAGVERSRRWGVGGVTHWLLTVPRHIVSPQARSACG
jgi:uncharacterized protein YecT (DUF1311 family)